MPTTTTLKPGDRVIYRSYDVRQVGTVVAVGGGYAVVTAERGGRVHTQPYVTPVEAVEVVS